MSFTGAMRYALVIFVLLVGASGLLQADDVVIDFFGPGNQAPAGANNTQKAAYNGTINYAGGVAPLMGSNINIGGVNGVNTPLNDGGMFSVTGTQAMTGMGTLNFTTGNYDGMVAGYRHFAGGGSFEIWGEIADLGISYRRLLWGSVLGAMVNDTGQVKLSIVDGTDTKDSDLVSAFGLDPVTTKFVFSGSLHSTRISTGLNGAFTSIASGSTNISNAVVPEPASIVLLGSVTLLVGIRLRKRLDRKPTA